MRHPSLSASRSFDGLVRPPYPSPTSSIDHGFPTGLTSVMPPLQGAPFRSLSVTVQQPVTSPTNPPPVPPPPRDPAVESAEAEARVRTFYTLFESYLPYMPLSDTLEQLARGTLSEGVLVGMSALVKRRVPASFRSRLARLTSPCPQSSARNALSGPRRAGGSRQSSCHRPTRPPFARYRLRPHPPRLPRTRSRSRLGLVGVLRDGDSDVHRPRASQGAFPPFCCSTPALIAQPTALRD